MSNFLQIHLLTAYAPANLNRDDLGRPKTAFLGGVERGRISSQCMKRSIRTNDVFKDSLQNLGTRTRLLGQKIQDTLLEKGFDEKEAIEYTLFLLRINYLLAIPDESKSKTKSEKESLPDLQVSFFSHNEIESLEKVLDFISNEKDAFLEIYKQKAAIYKAFKVDKPNNQQTELRNSVEPKLKFVSNTQCCPDVALFGRMMAVNPTYNVDASFQMNHPITVGSSQIESDYFTAVDELTDKNKQGAAHVNTQYYNSGIYYTYMNLNLDLFKKNLGDLNNKDEIVKHTIDALIKCAATVSPSGKQNAFASRNFADFVMVEFGSESPRSLVGAFYNPITGTNQVVKAVERLLNYKSRVDSCYGYKLALQNYFSLVDFDAQGDLLKSKVDSIENLITKVHEVL